MLIGRSSSPSAVQLHRFQVLFFVRKQATNDKQMLSVNKFSRLEKHRYLGGGLCKTTKCTLVPECHYFRAKFAIHCTQNATKGIVCMEEIIL